MKQILFVFGLFGLVSINANAEVKPIRPFCFTSFSCHHPDELDIYTDGYIETFFNSLKGNVKEVRVKYKSNPVTYVINKQGLIVEEIQPSYQATKYEYDDKNRIKSSQRIDENKDVTIEKFDYFEKKNMVLDTVFTNGKWNYSLARISSQDAKKGKIYYTFEANTRNVLATEFVLSPSSKWIRSSLGGPNAVSSNNETEAETNILGAFNCLQGKGCSNGWKVNSNEYAVIKSKDGEYSKFADWKNISWYKNGLIVEDTGMYKEMPDGTQPHGTYKYEYDDRGNWIKLEKWVNDIPGTITDDKPKSRKVEEETIIREIEYYNSEKN